MNQNQYSQSKKRDAQRATYNRIDYLRGGPVRLPLLIGGLSAFPTVKILGLDYDQPVKDLSYLAIIMAVFIFTALIVRIILKLILKRIDPNSRWRIVLI